MRRIAIIFSTLTAVLIVPLFLFLLAGCFEDHRDHDRDYDHHHDDHIQVDVGHDHDHHDDDHR